MKALLLRHEPLDDLVEVHGASGRADATRWPGIHPRAIRPRSRPPEAAVDTPGRFLDIDGHLPMVPWIMPTRLEESLERDIERIRQQVLEMSALAERALRDCVEALSGGRPPASLRGHSPRPVHRRDREGARSALPRVPGPAAARRDAAPSRLQHDQGQPRARTRRRLRREHRAPGPGAEQSAPAAGSLQGPDRRDGPARDPDDPRLRSRPSCGRTPRLAKGVILRGARGRRAPGRS